MSSDHTAVDYEKRIFSNRNLDLRDVALVGFDMDYTLAIYRETLKALTTRLTLQRLVAHHGYPEQILEIEYDPSFAIRGLVLDTHSGNIVKRDAHYHVSQAAHGFRKLSREERRAGYPKGALRLGQKRFVLLDTLFELPEAYLYARLVEWAEQSRGGPLKRLEYRKIYEQIRACVDLVHRDGSLKSTVMLHPDRYIERDPRLPEALSRLRAAGKRLFLLTNSEYSYTKVVMSYLLDEAQESTRRWEDYFDIVVVFARKPAFFMKREPFLLLDSTGAVVGPAAELRSGQVYQGGNLRDFERWAHASGDSVLYVGDHIYGDVLRSKKTAAWRTVMVVPEMEAELRATKWALPLLRTRALLDRQRRTLEDQRLALRAANGADPDADRYHAGRHLDEAVLEISDRLKGVQADLDRFFNPMWGRLFKTGDEHSAFGAQVEDYACLYTSRVSNFILYSATEYFRTPHDMLPHEHLEA
jgi:HAD superfamily 5'-nucleotidase-like hydrolase